MSKKEQVKSDIELLRNFLILVVTAIFGIIGYAIINIEILTLKQLFLGALALLILYVMLVFMTLKYFKARKELKES